MHVPAHFREDRRECLVNFICNHSFDLLVSVCDDVPVARHIPFLLNVAAEANGQLLGHMARGNPQWRSIESGNPVLATFQRPHAYVVPSWYRSFGVPTWNYVAIHMYGEGRVIDHAPTVQSMLDRLITEHESRRAQPWKPGLPETNLDRLLAEIIGFEIRITDIQGKFNLSQNRPEENRRQVIEQLRLSGSDTAAALAGLMEAQLRSVGASRRS